MSSIENSNQEWRYEISSKSSLINLNFNEIWRYKDLLLLLVKRDVVTYYKQTVLGPLWYIIQPLITSVIFTIIFNGIGDINVGDKINPFLFNLAGITIWSYFSECIKNTSNTFTKNQNLFNKVYFPRVVMPMSVVMSNLIKFFIQFLIFIGFYVYFYFHDKSGVLNIECLIFFPLLVFLMGLLGLGFGMMISSMTTKYRDLTFLVGFGVQLLMYISAVMYPINEAVVKIQEKFPSNAGVIKFMIENNPLSRVVEAFRYIFFSEGLFSVSYVFYTSILSLVIFLFGLLIFNKTEKSFIDTV